MPGIISDLSRAGESGRNGGGSSGGGAILKEKNFWLGGKIRHYKDLLRKAGEQVAKDLSGTSDRA